MASRVIVGSARAKQIVGEGEVVRVTHGGTSGSVYLGDGSVSSSSYDQVLSSAGGVVVQGPRWAIGSADIPVVVSDGAADRVSVNAETVHWIGGAASKENTGTSTTPTANRAYVGAVKISDACVLTGIRFDVGATGGTDKAIAVLYDNAGKVLAYSDKTGTTVGTADTYQSLPFVKSVEILSPGRYFIGIIYNGTTARIELSDASAGAYGATSVIGGTANSAADFTNAPVNITPPSTYGAVPFAHTY